MSLASLNKICLDRTLCLLMEGMWKSCIHNPFSELPSTVVDHLMELASSYSKERMEERALPNVVDSPKISDIVLLLTSGRLTRLNLRTFDLKADQEAIVRTLQTLGSNHLLNLDTYISQPVVRYLLRKMISWNPHVEELHLGMHKCFDVIRKCRNLRILKFYKSGEMYFDESVNLNTAVLFSLKNLEILHVPNMDVETMVNVLQMCPNLISIGLSDSLDGIAQRRLTNSLNFIPGSHLQLRRCVWGKEFWIEDSDERSVYKLIYCEKMKCAVTLCPLVKELIFYVRVKHSLKALRFLKQLSLLGLIFCNCTGNVVPHFIEVLQDIGLTLKHLSILGCSRVPVDVICNFCPHLQSLKIKGSIFMNGSSKFCNLPLKRLNLDEPGDKESLLFLLCNCKHLEELFLVDVYFFDDTLLNQILRSNNLSDLKVCCISYCRLSEEGIKMFLNTLSSIEKFLWISLEDTFYYDKNSSFKDPNLHYLKLFDFKQEEFFNSRLNENRF